MVDGWWLVVGGWWLMVGGWWLMVGGWWLSSSMLSTVGTKKRKYEEKHDMCLAFDRLLSCSMETLTLFVHWP